MVRQAWWSRLGGRQEEAAQKAPAEMAGTAPGQNLLDLLPGVFSVPRGPSSGGSSPLPLMKVRTQRSRGQPERAAGDTTG